MKTKSNGNQQSNMKEGDCLATLDWMIKEGVRVTFMLCSEWWEAKSQPKNWGEAFQEE